MRKVGHIIFASIMSFLFIYLTIYLGLSWFEFNFKSIALISIIIAFYSILPDIDHKNSSITWLFIGIGLLGVLLGIIQLFLNIENPNPLIVLCFSAGLLLITFIAGNFLKHRGIVHTIQFGLISSLPVYILSHSFFYAILAYVVWHSHLIGDVLWF
jgi:hypothetical protein